MRFGLFRTVLAAAALLSLMASAVDAAQPAQDVHIQNVEETSPQGDYLAGHVAAAERDTAAAADYFESVLATDPNNTILLDRTFRLLLANGNVKEALPLARRLIKLDPANRMGRLALAVDAFRQNQYSTVRKQLSQSQRNTVPDVMSLLVTAWSWQGSKNTKRALQTLDKLDGNDLAALFRDLHAGLLAEMAGQSVEATRRLEAAYRLDQSSFVVVDAYARRKARSGQKSEALDAYHSLEASAPRNPRILASIAMVEKGQKLDPLVKTARQGVAEALFGFGQLANRGESAEIALAYLYLALYLEPQHELALLTLADLYENLNQPARAVEAYDRIPAKSPFRSSVDIRVAVNLAQLGKMDEAIARLDGRITQDPHDLDAIVALGNLLHRNKMYDRAAEVFSKAINNIDKPGAANWSLYFARGVAYDAAKHWDKAEADLKQAFALSPEQPILLNYLGYSWIDRGMYLDQALNMVKKAVELRPNDGDIVDSLGWAYYRLGKYNESVSALERAIELKPSSWELNDHLGDAYWKVGRKLEARFQWLHALSLNIEDSKRDLVERKLKDGLEAVEAEAKAQEKPKDIPAETQPALQQPAAPPKDSRS